jgi:hypothetical protein
VVNLPRNHPLCSDAIRILIGRGGYNRGVTQYMTKVIVGWGALYFLSWHYVVVNWLSDERSLF